MVDVADLVVQGRTEGVDQVTSDLKAVAGAAKGAQEEVNHFSSATKQVAPAVDSANRALREQEKALKAAEGGLSGNQAALAGLSGHAGRANKVLDENTRVMRATQRAGLDLTRQFSDIGVSIAGGMPIWMVLTQQLPQISDGLTVAKQSGVNFRQALMGMVSSIPLVGAAIAAVLVTLGALAAFWAKGESDALSFERSVTGLGRTAGLSADQLRDLAYANAEAGDVSDAAARKMANAYVSTGQIGGENIGRLISITKDFASFTGTDVPAATEALAAAMAAPDEAGREMTRTFGLLTQQQLTQIDAAVKQGDQMAAQTIILDALTRAVDDHAANAGKITSAWDAIGQSISNAITRLGEFLYTDESEKLAKMERDILRVRMGEAAGDIGIMTQRRDALREEINLRRDNSRVIAQESRANQQAQRAADQVDRARAPRRAAMSEEQREYKSLIEASERMVEQLEREAATYGMGWQELARYNAEKQIAAIFTGAAADGTAELTEAEFNLVAAILAGNEAMIARRILMDGEKMDKVDNVQLRDLDVAVPEITSMAELAVEAFRKIDDAALDLGSSLAQTFGSAGSMLGNMIAGLTDYRVQMQELAFAQQEGDISAEKATRQRGILEAKTYADMAGAAKGFFDEKSKAYKVLQAVEMTYRAFQVAGAISAMIADSAETAATVANSAVKTSANTATGASKIFAQLGMWAFPVVGAMVAVMAALGMSGGGSVSAPTLPDTNDGSGSVLGEQGTPSESLTRSLEMAERYQNRDLDYSSRMVTSLKAIQANIGSLTTLIAREMNVGGALDPTGLNQGPTTSGGFLGMFTTTRSQSLVGSGINLTGGQLADLIANGVKGSLYQIVQMTKTKSGFLGFGGGTTTWNVETNTPLGDDMSAEFARVLASLRAGVLTAAGQLGITGAEAVLDSMEIALGRISFDGMSATEINQTLNAVFSQIGDQMVEAIVPGLVRFQQAGEGMLETLSRLIAEYQAVDNQLELMGMTFGAVGVGSIEARNRLVELAGGLDEFIEGSNFFIENFLTEAQQIAPIQARVTEELTRLGLATDITRSQFADLVMGLDLSTESGATMYAALMALAPALDRTLRYQEDIGGTIVDNANYDRERRELEIRLMQAQGRIAESLAAQRQLELDAMDASLRPLQLAVWAAQDMAAAAAELAAAEALAAQAQRQLAEQRRNMEIELMEATGNAAGALAARREMELAALDASLRPLQLAIWAALDLAAAQEELARAQEEAARAAEEAARIAAQIAEQRRGLEIDLMEAQGRSAEALAARRQLELEAMDASLRPLQLAVWAALDLAAATQELEEAQARAAEAALALAEQRRGLEIDLMEATGNAAGALAARRARELEAMDASLRPLQEAIWAALDLAEATRALEEAQAAAAEQARQLASQRRGLEIELMEAQGDSAGALAARRQLELEALDATLRPLQLAIWAALDLADATRALEEAQAEAARLAQEEADRLARLAAQRRDLDIQLMEATGDAAGALAARRADELAAMDESLRSTQRAIWAALDLAAAQEEATRAAEEAAAAAQRIAGQRRNMEIELLEVQGRTSEALAARRAMELEALDESLRPLQMQIYAAQDLAEAQRLAAEAAAAAAQAAREAAEAYERLQQEALDRVNDARDALKQAYEREAGALQNTIDKFRDFGMALREFRDSLDTGGDGASSYAAARSAFERTARLAQLGDAEALGQLTGVSKTFLDSALNNASSAEEYNLALGSVRAALDLAIGTSDRTATIAQQQLDALTAQVDGLIVLNESVLTVAQGIANLNAAIQDARRYGVTQFAEGGIFTSPTMFRMGSSLGQMAEAGPEAIVPLVNGPNGLGIRSTTDQGLIAIMNEVLIELGNLRADVRAGDLAIATNTGKSAKLADRWDTDGLPETREVAA